MHDPTHFESGTPPILQLDGPLPWGRLAIEASAGTGKTYALCHLAVRYIAEAGVPASGFLIVTFTRAATAELRWRIRKAILNRIEELQAGDPNLTPEDSDRHLTNLERAITEYDTITITTIHSFATQTVSSLGATSKYDPPRRFTTDDSETTRSACSDAIVRAASNGVDPELLPKVTDLVEVVSTAMQNPDIAIEPTEPEGEPTTVSVLASLARDVVMMLRLRRINRHEISFDDVLTSLRDSITSGNGSTIIESLRNRYWVVMIDEFQDTDPVQWAIFDAAFAERPNAKDGLDSSESNVLITVGDPKQSIYSFRGADISTYSAATHAQGTNRVALGTNYRSDGRVLKGLEVLLAGTIYGRGISFVPVKASEDNETRCALDDGSPVTPVQVRLALGDDIKRTTTGKIASESAQDAVWNDVVTTIHHTLDHVMIPTGKEADREYRPVKAQDIAVLVHSGYDAINVQRRLINSGVPAVLSRAGKVLESPAADQWRWLLDALARPSDSARARRFALGWFAGLDVQTLDKGDDTTMVSLFNQLRSWLEVLRESGVASFVHRVIDDSGVTARVLSSPDGDRSVTDLLHIGELLQTSSTEHRPTVANLLDLLHVSDSKSGDEDNDEYARRIETQDSAVRIMTIWVSKGLEFPIVMAPTLFTDKEDKKNKPEIVVSDGTGGRIFDLDRSNSDRLDEAIALKINENLRLLYVALTRSSHQVTTWWAPARNTAKSSLARVLFARDENGLFDPEKYSDKKIAVPKNAEDAASILSLAANSGGLVDISIIGAGEPSPIWNGPASDDSDDGSTSGSQASGELAAVELDGLPRRTTGRWSFSAITSSELVTSDPNDSSLGDSGASDEHQAGPESMADSGGSVSGDVDESPTDTDSIPLGWLPAGAAFGTLVHSVYEQIDFTEPDPEPAIRAVINHELSWRSLDLTPPLQDNATDQDGLNLLTQGIVRTLTTPLGALFNNASLDSLGHSDRLSELSFELLLGADAASASATITDKDLGRVISRWLDDDVPLKAWAQGLESGRFGVDLGGHLTGSIDAVLRVKTDDGHARFVVVDYKTNRLSGAHDTPTPLDYGPAQMTEAMIHHHYPLQSLLYSVALHRYLRSRLSNYDPEQHLGGVAYLFVRGMVGPDSPVIDGHTTGVWSWTPPSGLVIELSDLLAGVTVPAKEAS